MSISFLVDPEQHKRIPLYIDTRDGSARPMSKGCWLSQGESPCNGSTANPCYGKWSRCNHCSVDKNEKSTGTINKLMCVDEVGRILDEHDGNMPDWVQEEWIDVAPTMWAIKEHVISETMDIKGDKVYQDRAKYNQIMLRMFLKDWSLSDKHEELKIEIMKSKKFGHLGLTELTDKCYRTIVTRVSDKVMTNIVRVISDAYKGESYIEEAEEDVVAAVEEDMGIRMPVKN